MEVGEAAEFCISSVHAYGKVNPSADPISTPNRNPNHSPDHDPNLNLMERTEALRRLAPINRYGSRLHCMTATPLAMSRLALSPTLTLTLTSLLSEYEHELLTLQP